MKSALGFDPMSPNDTIQYDRLLAGAGRADSDAISIDEIHRLRVGATKCRDATNRYTGYQQLSAGATRWSLMHDDGRKD
jgi:hypothetical protein